VIARIGFIGERRIAGVPVQCDAMLGHQATFSA
jgi:hypothetical protein